jgi:hypothetical protein
MLSALERLDLTDRLDELMVRASSANGLDLLDINDEIDVVMERLGYGSAAVEPVGETEPDPISEPEPAGSPETVKEEELVTPPIVTEFLAGKFIQQSQSGFLDTLRSLSEYVGLFLSLDQVKEQSEKWITESGYSL